MIKSRKKDWMTEEYLCKDKIHLDVPCNQILHTFK